MTAERVAPGHELGLVVREPAHNEICNDFSHVPWSSRSYRDQIDEPPRFGHPHSTCGHNLMLLSIVSLTATAFTAPTQITTLQAPSRAAVQLSETRRVALQTAALATAALLTPAAAFAAEPGDVVGSFSKIAPNTEGDAALYTPKAIIEASGVKSSRLIMKMPDPGPLRAGDYIDAMWFEDSRGNLYGAALFRDDGKGIKEQVDGVKKAPVYAPPSARSLNWPPACPWPSMPGWPQMAGRLACVS